jgi:hypothetical protein
MHLVRSAAKWTSAARLKATSGVREVPVVRVTGPRRLRKSLPVFGFFQLAVATHAFQARTRTAVSPFFGWTGHLAWFTVTGCPGVQLEHVRRQAVGGVN